MNSERNPEREHQLDLARREREAQQRQREENLKRIADWQQKRQGELEAQREVPIRLEKQEFNDTQSILVYDGRPGCEGMRKEHQIGAATASIEHQPGVNRVRLHHIEVREDCRDAGIAGKMLTKVEGFAKEHGATEIYGAVTSTEAHRFWVNQARHGWTLEPNGYSWTVHKKLS